MDRQKQWVLLTGLLAVLILVGGWIMLISPTRTEAAELREQTAAQLSANALKTSELEVLEQQARELPDKAAQLARVTAKIPDNPALPLLIRALTAASDSAGVELVSITPGPPVAAPAAPVAAVPAPAPGAAVPPPAPADAATGAAPAPLTPAVGALATVPVVLQVVGGYFETAQFLALLEDLPRALKVSNLTVAPGTSPTAEQVAGSSIADGRSLASTITGTVFLVAAAPAPVAPPVAAPVPAPTT